MGLTFLPQRISGSVGATKSDAEIKPYSDYILPSGEWNNAAQALVDVCSEVGLADGSTPDSIKQKLNGIQAANIILFATNSFLPSGSVLTAGPNITINQNGSLLEITASASGGNQQFVEGSPSPRLRTTASLAIGAGSQFAEDIQSDISFYVSGSSLFSGSTIHSNSLISRIQIDESSSHVLEVFVGTTESNPRYVLNNKGMFGGFEDDYGNVVALTIETMGGIITCADINLLGGDSNIDNSGSGGDINILAGDSNSGNGQAGNINLLAGDGSNDGGDIGIVAGDITGSSSVDAGWISIRGGNSKYSGGGGVYVYGGNGSQAELNDANGGYIYLVPGSGSRIQTFPSGNFQGAANKENYYDEHGAVTAYGHHKYINGFYYIHSYKFASMYYAVTSSDVFVTEKTPHGTISSSYGSMAYDTTNGFAYISKKGSLNTDWAKIIDETLTGSIVADHIISNPNFVSQSMTYSMSSTNYQMAVSSSDGGGDSLIVLPSTGLTNSYTYTIFDCKGTAGNASTDVYITSSILFSDDTSKKKMGNFGRFTVAYNSSKNRYLITEYVSISNA